MQRDFCTKYFYDLRKMMSPEAQLLQLKWHQFQFRLRLRPRPRYDTQDDAKGPPNRLVEVPCSRHWHFVFTSYNIYRPSPRELSNLSCFGPIRGIE